MLQLNMNIVQQNLRIEQLEIFFMCSCSCYDHLADFFELQLDMYMQHSRSYSASRQESEFFELLFFEVKWASLCLITSTDIIKITFIIFLHNSLSPYIANREAAQVQAVFEPFFANLGQKWQYLKSTLELNLQIWESETNINTLRGSSGFS